MHIINDTPRFEALIKGQGEVLQMITRSEPLPLILEKLVHWVEGQSDEGMVASVLLTDKGGRHLIHGAAPSLPPAYNAAINGIAIGPNSGSCGTAAFTKKQVIVENIDTDPLWADFRELALGFNLYSCWSIPLINVEGMVRGTFATYYNEPKTPSDDDLHLMTLVSQIALMAIEYRIAEDERQQKIVQEQLIYKSLEESERNFRNLVMKAPVGICIVKGDAYFVETVNENFLKLVGRQRNELEHQPYWEALKEAAPYYAPILEKVKRSGVAHVGKEEGLALIRNGKEEQLYVSFVYEPITEPDGMVERVMILGIEVTEQVVARKRVEESEQQVRSLVESAPFPIGVYIGKEMRIQLANQAMIDIWGKDPDVVGKLYADILPELDNQEVFEQLNAVYTTGIPYHARNQHLDLVVNGKVNPYYFHYSFTPVLDANGKVIGVMNTGADVTDLNMAHRRIEESERNLRNIIIQAPVAMCIFRGPNHVLEIANSRMYELWGRGGEELLGKPIFEGLPEAAEQGFESLLQKVYTTGETHADYGVPINLPRQERLETVYINFVYEAFRDGDGTISAVMAVATDVTEQVLAIKKIEEAEERARLAVESAELGTYEVNLQTNDLVVSPRLATIFNVENSNDRNRYITAIHQDDLKIREEAYGRAYKTGILDYEGRVQWKDGSLHWIRVKGKVFMNEEKMPARILGVVQEITEQKIFAEALSQQVRERTLELETKNKELQHSNIKLEEFAYAASHDLKEPIRKVHFFTDQLRNQLKDRLKPEDVRIFERIKIASQRMSSLIEDLLVYSHVSHKPLETEEVDLNEKVKKVLEDLEVEIEQKGAHVDVGSLPVITGYRRQLQQLLQNLISNALKYHKPGEAPEICIRSKMVNGEDIDAALTEIERSKSYHLITVSDKGIGFEQSLSEKIFQLFQRLHGNTEYKGTGIGLSIAKKVIENHNGFIIAESAPGEGATFKIYLPS